MMGSILLLMKALLCGRHEVARWPLSVPGSRHLAVLVLVKHEGGWITAYAHLGNVSVEEGQRLEQGSVIGSPDRDDRPG